MSIQQFLRLMLDFSNSRRTFYLCRLVPDEEIRSSYRDICYNYFNENCVFIGDSVVDNEEELKNDFIKNRNNFLVNSKWQEFLNRNKLKSNS